MFSCFLNVHRCHPTLRIEYAACIFRAVIISRPGAFFFLLVKQSALAYVIFTKYIAVTAVWLAVVFCIYTGNIPSCPHRTIDVHMYGTYYGCHHLFNKQFGSWLMQWITNGGAATKFKSPVWFMAALLEPHSLGVLILYMRYSVMLGMSHTGRSDHIWGFLKWRPSPIMVPVAASSQS